MRAHLVLPSLLLLLLALPAGVRANVTGSFQFNGQSALSSSEHLDGSRASAASTLLQESLVLQWSSMPFGPSVALLSMGGTISNTHGPGAAPSRNASVNASLGLLPKRSYPLRLYARADVLDERPGSTIGGAGPTLLTGATLNLEPGLVLPALRLNIEELRTTSPFTQRNLGDLRRSISMDSYRTFGAHQVRLNLRSDSDQREQFGEFDSLAGTIAWAAPSHQTSLLASRTTQTQADLSGLSSQRNLNASHNHTLSRKLGASADARLSEARGGDARGESAGGVAGLTFRPFFQHDLSLSASANGGVSRTTSPLARGESRTYGGDVRAGYGRPIGRVSANVFTGVAADQCDCDFGNAGRRMSVDTGFAVGTTAFDRLQLGANYVLTQVFAPSTRGGDRIEHRAGATSTWNLLDWGQASLGLGYSETQREFLNIVNAVVIRQRERAASASLGYSTYVVGTDLNANVSHARGSVVVPETAFVVNVLPTASATTQASLLASRPLFDGAAAAHGSLLGSWTSLRGSDTLSTYGAMAGLNYGFGRFTASLDYQFSRSFAGGFTSDLHLVRTSLSRPFEF